jgi:transposase-like protein
VAEDLKAVYRSFARSQAEAQFDVFREKWQAKYPREVSSWEQDLPMLLTFLKYPSSIRSVIYTTNWIERTIKEIRKRLRPMNSLPDVKAAEKIVYLTVQHLNDIWSERKLRGFASAYSALQEMFTERYG